MTPLRPTRLLSLGSMLVDIRIEVPHLPPRGGDVIGSAAATSAAGGFNILAAASRNGMLCAFAGRHGTGPNGSRIRDALAREGIVTLETPSPEGDSGFCLVMVEPGGERTFVTSPGVEARLGARDFARLAFSPSDAVFVSGYDLCYNELGLEIATLAAHRDIILVVDPGPMVAEIPANILDAVLPHTRILTLNRREAAVLAGAAETDRQGQALLARLRRDALVVLRDAAEGCFLFGGELSKQPVHVPVAAVRALDTTGAGDAHTGVLVAALASGLDPISAAERANGAAAISVTRRGPATAPTREELDVFLMNRPQSKPPTMKEPATINEREEAMTTHISRKTFNALLGATLGAAFGSTPWRRAAAAGEITVLNWKGYGTDEAFALKAFAEATGITVKHDYFNAEAEMLTKLRTNPGAYDVVLINSARIQQAQADGLIDAIDLGAVPNAKDLAGPLKNHPNLEIGGKPYGVAWVWGMNSLGVRHDKAADVQSWAVFSDPKYKGRLALFDDSTTEVGIGALLTGQDINNPKDLKSITAALKAMKPNVKLIWSSEDEWNKAFAADAFDISVYWSGAAARSVKVHKLPVDFIIPKEGAIGWLDTLTVASSSKDKPAALQFINYMIDPKFYVTWATQAGAPASANAAAMAALPADDLNRQIHKSEYLSKLQFMSALPDDRRQAFNDVWEEVKAFFAS